MSYDYDIVFVGGGLNYAGAVVAKKAGKKVALIEKRLDRLGGTCLHNGCIPSKMYLHAAETIERSKRSFIRGEIALDMQAIHRKKEALLSKATEAIRRQCKGIDLIEGEGRVIAPHTVAVGEETIRGERIVIGTGATPFIPEGIVYDAKRIITSDEMLNLQELPHKIAVYGDGAIGLEAASFFAAAGVKTELFFRHETLFDKAHPQISRNLSLQCEELGIVLHPGSTIVSAVSDKEGVAITLENGENHHVPMLLVATGRKASVNVVETPKIETNPKGIVTDMHFETTLPDHYAIGDCNGKVMLAHAARAQALYVVERILGQTPEPIRLDRIVRFIHTIPCAYATVGANHIDLQKRAIEYRESVVPLKGLPFAHTHEGDNGLMIVYSDTEGFLLGCEIFAPMAEELIAIAAMALAGEMDAATMKRTVLAHPTFSESLEKAYGRLR